MRLKLLISAMNILSRLLKMQIYTCFINVESQRNYVLNISYVLTVFTAAFFNGCIIHPVLKKVLFI